MLNLGNNIQLVMISPFEIIILNYTFYINLNINLFDNRKKLDDI